MLFSSLIKKISGGLRTGPIILVLISLLHPFTAMAQVSTKSSNYEVDNINFGTNFTITTKTAVLPEISSEGPQILELDHDSVTIAWKTDKSSTSFVEYGTTTDYGTETGRSDSVKEHQVTVLGLTAQTLYHFRVKSTDAFGGIGVSEDSTFTTPAAASIDSIKVFNVSYEEAFVTWKTGAFSTSKVVYGTSTAYGSEKSSLSLSFVTDHTIHLTDLTPGTEYHFQIVAENDKGDVLKSSDFTFTTIANPAFELVSVPSIDENEVSLYWRTNVFTTGIVTYQSDKDTKPQTAGDSTLRSEHTVSIRKLYGLTVYKFHITATDAQGKQINSKEQTFSTLRDTQPPQISDLKVNVTRSGESLIMTATWKTNEPAKGKVVFNPKTDAEKTTELPEAGSYINEHVVVASGVNPSTPYALTVTAADPFDNESQDTINFATPGLHKSILQLILDSILTPFGWLSRAFG